nr:Trk system potassium transporter TrkA [uncultured Catonella sp.]
MNIIIVGCGKVGYALARELSNEKNDICIIDRDSIALQNAVNILDVQAVCGDGTGYKMLLEAGVKDADLLIAVTDKDEINLLCCLMAKKAGNCQTIARVRNPQYYEEINYIKEELGLSMAINPERIAAFEIARLIHFPSAIEVDTFYKGRVNLISLTIGEDSILDGMSLIDFSKNISNNVLICMVRRDGKVEIPNGSFVLRKGDTFSCILKFKDSYDFFHNVGVNTRPIENVIICGGGTVSYYLCLELVKAKIDVKIIEADSARCAELSELIPEAIVIHGDATDKRILLEEGIENADAVVTLTNIDEENILLSMYTHHISKAKSITKINKIEFEEVIRELPIGSVIAPKHITSHYILKYVRSMQSSKGSNVETLYKMFGNEAEALEFLIKSDSKITKKTLEKLNIKQNVIVAAIYRNHQVITPSGKDIIQKGDSVIIITTNTGLGSIDDIIAE